MGGVERISQESQLEQKDVYKNQLQGNKKWLYIWRSDDGKVCQGGQQGGQHGEECGSWPGGELCHHRPDFHLNVVVLSLFQYLAGQQSAPYMTSVGSKLEE